MKYTSPPSVGTRSKKEIPHERTSSAGPCRDRPLASSSCSTQLIIGSYQPGLAQGARSGGMSPLSSSARQEIRVWRTAAGASSEPISAAVSHVPAPSGSSLPAMCSTSALVCCRAASSSVEYGWNRKRNGSETSASSCGTIWAVRNQRELCCKLSRRSVQAAPDCMAQKAGGCSRRIRA